ncbi:MAG TPA: helix-turn-helix domain-containing protein [Jiangellaceae bacterium]|nr:helix-turn-helix domain-containing protein [Jiangellaceae bacterium]
MRSDVDVSVPARLIGEPGRAAMLSALLSGEALAAGELARAARVSPATASEHLARLRAGGLVEVVPAGRHRYYRLASPDVAQVLEALAAVSPSRPVRSLRQSNTDAAMAFARTCYDHLAGRVGVAIHDALVAAGYLVVGGDGYALTDPGLESLATLGVDVVGARGGRRIFAMPCLDFTERRPHLAGALGAAFCRQAFELGWVVRRRQGQRALRLTDAGRAALGNELGVVVPD